MRSILRSLFALAATAISSPALRPAEIEAASKIDAVTVYPDAAIVTRVAEVELSQGDNVARLQRIAACARSGLAARRGRSRTRP